MKEEYIKTFEGSYLGIIRTDENGDKAALAWPSRQILGFYRKSRDVTTDFYGRVIAQGDAVSSLISNPRLK